MATSSCIITFTHSRSFFWTLTTHRPLPNIGRCYTYKTMGGQMKNSASQMLRSAKYLCTLGACATSVIALMSGGALAQQAQQSGGQANGLEEVIVTATKRSTTLQETPIS